MHRIAQAARSAFWIWHMAVPHPPVVVLSSSEAAAVLEGRGAASIGAIISIHGRRESPLQTANVARRLVLQFDDTETPTGKDPIADYHLKLRQRRAVASGGVAPPAIEDAQAIIGFAGDIAGSGRPLLCHCQGGISRSPAAALLCLTAWTGPGEEAYCVEYLRRVRPCAIPHRGLVAFGDELLERGGQLIDRLDAMRRY